VKILSRFTFGLVIPQGWRWLEYNSNSAIKQYHFSKEIIHLADMLGYNSAYAYDHLLGGAIFKANRMKNFFECFTLISSLLTITDKIRFGQVVTCNSYRNPALLAKMISTMDIISNGRMELGIGAGWYKDECLSYGYDYPVALNRINRLNEALNIIKLLWKQKTSTFSGEYYSIKDAVCNPKPIQKPHPTIMIGGTGEKFLLKTVARHADRYNHPFASPLDIRRRLYILKEHCNTIGRHYSDIERSIVIRCFIRGSEEEINHEIAKAKRKNESSEDFKKRLSAIIGTPEEVTSKLHEYIDLGITHFILHFIGLNQKSLELFNSEIIKKI
jgi:alkanesulfonate monooxygenase SsuD/methylene tetrahydromethanopterin reductase-like flavin-dependent oxidoreductase (luciferase family)